jgi:hypothetical protein
MEQNYDPYAPMLAAAEAEAQSGSGFEPVVCPRSYGQPCPLCEQVGIKWDEAYLGQVV